MAIDYTIQSEDVEILISFDKGGDGLTPYIGENGNWWIGLTDTGVSATPNGIESITLLSTVGLVNTYRILFTDNTHFDYAVSDGAKGDKGDTGKSAYQSYLDTTTDNPPLSESAWANLFGDKLDVDGDGSDTTVTFAEAGTTALPVTGEKQSILWGKVLRYLKTQIPAWLSDKIDGTNLAINLNGQSYNYETAEGAVSLPDLLTPEGDGSGVQAGQNVDEEYITQFPNDGENWSLYTWFGVIRAKIDRLFTTKLDTTGNGSNTTVAFAEAGVTALPASGEKQSTLWGKVLRYFKTEIPAWITAVYDTIYQQFKETSFQGAVNVYYRYIGTSYVISETAPTTEENAPYALSGTNTTTHTFAGTLQRNGFYSPKSTYSKNIYFTGLTQNTTYNVTTMAYSIKGQQIFSVTGSFSTGHGITSYLFTMNIPNSLVYQTPIDYVIGDAYQEVISISKDSSGGNSTIYISNNPTAGTLSTMTRYGGVIYGTDIFSEAANKTLDGFVTAELAKVKQTVGTSTTDVLSQNAVAVYYEPKARATAQISRIEADGGLVRNKAMLYKLMQEQADLMPYCDLLYIPECGIKTRTVAATSTTPPYVYVPKLYDLIGSNDAAQTTESLQPFLGGNIAPNEKYKIKSAFGSGSFMAMTYAILNSKSYTYTFIVDYNNFTSTQQAIFYAANGDRISIVSGVIQIQNNGASVVFTCPGDIKSVAIGRMAIISVVTTLTNIFYYFNGELKYSIAYTPQPITWVKLLGGSSTYSYGSSFQYMQIHTKQLSTSEVSILHSQLRGYFPEIESITIGNQEWTTSGLDLASDAIGGAIPEVQNATSIETILNGSFTTNDLSQWTNKTRCTMAWNALQYAEIVSNSTIDFGIGFSDLTNMNKWVRLRFKAKSPNTTSQPKFITAHYSNITYIKRPALTTDWQDYEFVAFKTGAQSFFYLVGSGAVIGTQVDIDDVQFETLGWADLTVPAWCHWGNLTENGAVFGKLYNWYATLQLASNCPKGWRIPNYYDFVQLQTYLGGNTVAGGKLKYVGLDYWNTPNMGATNENGLSLIGAGSRDAAGAFVNIKNVWQSRSSRIDVISSCVSAAASLDIAPGIDVKRGFSLRLIRNSPAGEQVAEVSTGLITTDIASAYKQVTIPFGYRIKSITCTSATNLTSVAANAYTAGGTLIQNIITGKTAAANVPICYGVTADQSVQYADYTVRITATGVTSAGALFQIQIEKILL